MHKNNDSFQDFAYDESASSLDIELETDPLLSWEMEDKPAGEQLKKDTPAEKVTIHDYIKRVKNRIDSVNSAFAANDATMREISSSLKSEKAMFEKRVLSLVTEADSQGELSKSLQEKIDAIFFIENKENVSIFRYIFSAGSEKVRRYMFAKLLDELELYEQKVSLSQARGELELLTIMSRYDNKSSHGAENTQLLVEEMKSKLASLKNDKEQLNYLFYKNHFILSCLEFVALFCASDKSASSSFDKINSALSVAAVRIIKCIKQVLALMRAVIVYNLTLLSLTGALVLGRSRVMIGSQYQNFSRASKWLKHLLVRMSKGLGLLISPGELRKEYENAQMIFQKLSGSLDLMIEKGLDRINPLLLNMQGILKNGLFPSDDLAQKIERQDNELLVDRHPLPGKEA